MFLVVSCATIAGAVLSDNADRDRIRITYEEFVPYSFTDTQGAARGLSIDLMERLAAAAGYEVEMIPSPNPAASIQMIADGRADVTALLALTPERLQIGLPTTELGAFELRAFVRHNHPANAPVDLSGLEVGAVGGSFAVTGAREIPFSELVEYGETDNLIIPLLTGEVEAVVSASDSFLGRLREAEVEQYVRSIDPPLISSPYGFIVSPLWPELQQILNETIASELAGNELSLLRQLWFGRSKTWKDDPLTWWIVAGGLAGLLTLSYVGWIARRHRMRSERLLRESTGNDLLITALDEVTAAIVIYDANLKAIHWNRGFEGIFPELTARLEAGMTMRDMVRSTHHPAFGKGVDAKETDQQVDDVIASVQAGTSKVTKLHTEQGRVFEAREFKLGANHYASIRVDITRLQQQQDTILAQAERLEDANEQLQTFAAIAAHDLKAPLNQQKALISFITEDLEEVGIALPDDIQHQLGLIENVADKMSVLIQDLLLYAQSDSENKQVDVIRPAERLPEIVALCSVPDGFEVVIAPDMPDIQINPVAFDTVLRNLISNAVKHHDREVGTISVSAERTGDLVTMKVADDGPGIPPEFRQTIFEPFKRLTSAVEGSGLGLAYIRKTVESWDGSVTVDAVPTGGSVFTVEIPQRRANDLMIGPRPPSLAGQSQNTPTFPLPKAIGA